MKIYTCPEQVPAPEPDYSRYDVNDEIRKEEEHKERLAGWLKTNGYPGKYTGEIFSVPMADGYAQYMIADGRSFCLIHLPYGDAWDSRDVQFLPKKEILRRVESEKKLKALFAAR